MNHIFNLDEKKQIVQIKEAVGVTIKEFLDELNDFFRENDLGHRVYILKDV